jgi:uncharacterized protein (TIGR02996 family)
VDDFAAFIDAIRRDRGDDGLRLVFADWLEERGDPRAELVRWQVARARLAADDPVWLDLARREQDWLQRHRDLLLGGLQEHVSDWRLERGFVEEVTVEASAFLERAEALCAAAPLALVRVVPDRESGRDGDALLRGLAELPQLDRVHELELQRCVVGAEGAAALAACARLGELSALDLGHNLLGDGGLQALAWSRRLGRLERLLLPHNLIGNAGVAALAEAPHLGRLGVLDLQGNSVSDAGLAALAAGPLLGQLTTLNLADCMVSDLGVWELVHSGRLERLRGLDLSGNHVTNAGARLLADCAELRGLRGLDLGGNHLTGLGKDALRASPYLGYLFRDRYGMGSGW